MKLRGSRLKSARPIASFCELRKLLKKLKPIPNPACGGVFCIGENAMKLIENWRATLTGSWSLWLILASLVLLAGYFLALVNPELLGWDPLYF